MAQEVEVPALVLAERRQRRITATAVVIVKMFV
jgi:hypothetical protein